MGLGSWVKIMFKYILFNDCTSDISSGIINKSKGQKIKDKEPI